MEFSDSWPLMACAIASIGILPAKHSSTLKVLVWHGLLNLFLSPPSPGLSLPPELPLAAALLQTTKYELSYTEHLASMALHRYR
jgi:hypothetical protein